MSASTEPKNNIELFKNDYTSEQFKLIKLDVKWLMSTIDDYQLKPLADACNELSILGFPLVLLKYFCTKTFRDPKRIITLFDLAFAALPSNVLEKVNTFVKLYSQHLFANIDHYDLTFGQIEDYLYAEEGTVMELESYEDEERLYNREEWANWSNNEIDMTECLYMCMYDEEEMEIDYSNV